MHGLINKALQCFVVDLHGLARWNAIAHKVGLEGANFEVMWHYDDHITRDVISAISKELELPKRAVLEDVGTYLVSHRNVQAVRRLLRFSGVTYVEFLHSLDDLHARAHLALSDLDFPHLELTEFDDGDYVLRCHHPFFGFSFVMMGVLRTMADDYGALVLLEHRQDENGSGLIRVRLIEEAFSDGNHFFLGAQRA